jgi:uncharacterized FlaG/YvyC family protein
MEIYMMIQKRKRIILNFPIDTDIKDLVNVIIEQSSDLIKQIIIPSKDNILETIPEKRIIDLYQF